MVINTHVCRGNYHSTWASQGGYEPVAQRLFGRENVDAFYLEFDDARSGGFEPLRFVPQDKKVALGLITTKSPSLELKKAVIHRIKEATQYIPLERLCLSPSAGSPPVRSATSSPKSSSGPSWPWSKKSRKRSGASKPGPVLLPDKGPPESFGGPCFFEKERVSWEGRQALWPKRVRRRRKCHEHCHHHRLPPPPRDLGPAGGTLHPGGGGGPATRFSALTQPFRRFTLASPAAAAGRATRAVCSGTIWTCSTPGCWRQTWWSLPRRSIIMTGPPS